MRRGIKVCVLMGGDSSEREVSLRSGRGVAKALSDAGYDVLAIDVSWRWEGASRRRSGVGQIHNLSLKGRLDGTAVMLEVCTPCELADRLFGFGADVAFIALHGGYGEDGTIQAHLEFLGIPHTSPPSKACMIAMDKRLTKQLLISAGLPTAQHFSLCESELERFGMREVIRRIESSFGFPCAVKPACEGSTIGVSKVTSSEQLEGALKEAFSYGSWCIIERWINGTEVTCPVLGEGEDAFALPLIEIVPKASSGFYDYEAKYTVGMSDHIIPPRLPKDVQSKVSELGLSVHRLLGCSGFTRTDMIVDENGEPFVLELNAVPGMTETSLVPHAAEAYGWSFPQLVDWVVQDALRRWRRLRRLNSL
ncbi:MAG: D-alanine--D-alanine ligase [Armatimonadota bacterium]|nr:D-alanine--D-alanine ligase [Armatimonadota bacterium]MCX7777572.1 D-alanine--D-alanine ligase [Armatimonadota bacterium]MDW8025581.1 D-alanine--D-alanine ligase [Armatimonadota bacterium]